MALVFVDSTRAVLAERFGLVRPPGLHPFTGLARVAFHVDEAIGLSAPTAMAIASLVIFGRRWVAILPGLIWLSAVGYLATHYPAIRGEALRLVYLGAELAGLAISVAAIVTWGWRLKVLTTARVCMILVCCIDGGLILAGAQRWGFWSRWDLQQYAISLLYIVLVTYQGMSWRSFSPLP
jgi:hypothetical protein